MILEMVIPAARQSDYLSILQLEKSHVDGGGKMHFL
jgi:hypothetical protein